MIGPRGVILLFSWRYRMPLFFSLADAGGVLRLLVFDCADANDLVGIIPHNDHEQTVR